MDIQYRLKMNHLKQKLLAKKEKSSMEQEIIAKSENVKGEPKQKGRIVLEWVFIIIYLVLLIFFVFKPLMEFMLMIEYEMKLTILKYFTG